MIVCRLSNCSLIADIEFELFYVALLGVIEIIFVGSTSTFRREMKILQSITPCYKFLPRTESTEIFIPLHSIPEMTVEVSTEGATTKAPELTTVGEFNLKSQHQERL